MNTQNNETHHLHIGMRKIKSIIAVAVAFAIWQILRMFLPSLEPHPIFAYIYAIIEMRDTSEKTKTFGIRRIRATIIGLVIGLLFVSLSIQLCSLTDVQWLWTLIDFVLVMCASLTALCAAELFKCENFCGIAAIITVICLISTMETNRYLYAIMRVVQTVIGVVSALIVNSTISKK